MIQQINFTPLDCTCFSQYIIKNHYTKALKQMEKVNKIVGLKVGTKIDGFICGAFEYFPKSLEHFDQWVGDSPSRGRQQDHSDVSAAATFLN